MLVRLADSEALARAFTGDGLRVGVLRAARRMLDACEEGDGEG